MVSLLAYHRTRTFVIVILLSLLLRATAEKKYCSNEVKPRCCTRLPKKPSSSNPKANFDWNLPVSSRSVAELSASSPTSTFHMLVMDPPSKGYTTAIEHAGKLAASYWTSSVPVRVKVSFHGDFDDPYTLGDSRSTSAWFINGHAYPVALTKAIIGQDLNYYDPGDDYFDVIIRLNKNTSFYTETDGLTPWVEFDLVTVVLHEVFHGLMLTGGGIEVIRNFRGPGYLARFLDSSYEWRYEAFLAVATEDGRDCSITSYRGNYELLGSAVTSNNLWFRSSKERIARIESPNTFQLGSSLYHLSEEIYGEEGTGNDLMTPSLPTFYSSHLQGSHVKEIQALMLDETERGAPFCENPAKPARITDDDLFLISIGIEPESKSPTPTPTQTATATSSPSPSLSSTPVAVAEAGSSNYSVPQPTHAA